MVVKWDIKIKYLINSLQFIGTALETECSSMIFRILLEGALEVIKVSETYGGNLIPLNITPTNKGEEFVYFELIFKSSKDCVAFLKAIGNRSLY